MSNTLECHSFSEPLASAGELLHTSEQISTFMTTDLLSEASSILKRGSGSEHLDIPGTFSEHPASPVLLTSKGPHKAQATPRFTTVRIFALSNAEDLSHGDTRSAPRLVSTRKHQGTFLAQPLGRKYKDPNWAGWQGSAAHICSLKIG